MAIAERVSRVEISELAIPEAEIVRPKAAKFWGALRLLMGATFFWAFLDKFVGLGFSTGRMENGGIDFYGPDAWLRGGSPTDGVLQYAVHTKGPLVDFYQGLVGSAWVEWVYMLSFGLIGVALLIGVGTRLAGIGGAIWMAIIYSATSVWPEHNPVVDQHVVYAVLLVALAYVGAGRWFGFGDRWRKTKFVQRYPIFE